MRYVVNDAEFELQPSGAQVERLSDRLVVRTAEGAASALSARSGDSVLVSFKGTVYEIEKASARRAKQHHHATGDIHAPMPGQIVELFVEEGTQVALGQKLLVLEAMKMQHTMSAPFAGRVMRVPVRKGDQVGEGQPLVSVEPADE